MRVTLEQRLSAAAAKVLGDNRVDLSGGDARRDNWANQLVGLPDTDAGLPHEGNFTFRFKLNHGEGADGMALISIFAKLSASPLADWR
jgi:hypothetical protein